MNEPGSASPARVSTAELREVVESLFCPGGGRGGLARLERRASLYGSSHSLEELDLDFADGTSLRLMFKDLGTLLAEARHAKPAFLRDPRSEIETYRTILGAAGLGTAVFHGGVCDSKAGRFWLFIERVSGTELYQIGEFAAWQEVARWLARLHVRFADQVDELADRVPLVRYGPAYYGQWPKRAQEFLRDVDLPPDVRAGLDRLLRGYERVIERLLALPSTLVHGDFYASNILVHETEQGLRVCPIDWELAAVGPGFIDLAALTAGKWSAAQKEGLALAYYEALPSSQSASLTKSAFLNALGYCRLQCAVQWLGWSADWSPPAAQAHDWVREALHQAARLGLT